jgi:hypothetical protein
MIARGSFEGLKWWRGKKATSEAVLSLTEENTVGPHSFGGGLLGHKQWTVDFPQRKPLSRSTANSTVSNYTFSNRESNQVSLKTVRCFPVLLPWLRRFIGRSEHVVRSSLGNLAYSCEDFWNYFQLVCWCQAQTVPRRKHSSLYLRLLTSSGDLWNSNVLIVVLPSGGLPWNSKRHIPLHYSIFI